MNPLSSIRTVRRRAWSLGCSLALCSLPALPQQLTHSFNRPFSEDQALISAVKAFNQDSQGFLWLTGKRTLHRYNGINVQTIATLRDDLTGLGSDPTGTVWLGTKAGGVRTWDPKTQVLESWQPPEGSPALSNRVNALTVDSEDQIWVAMEDGIVFRIDPATGLARTFRPREIDPKSDGGLSITSLSAVGRGQVWLGTARGRIFRHQLDHSGFDEIELTDSSSAITAVAAGSDERVWAGARDGTLFQIDGSRLSRRIVIAETAGSAVGQNHRINALVEDPQGHLWVGSQQGLMILTPEDNSLRSASTQPEAQGVPSTEAISTLYLDRSGVLWIADKDGVVSTTSTRASAFSQWRIDNEGSSAEVTSITTGPDGSLWVGTHLAGLLRRLPSGEVVAHGAGSESTPGIGDRTAMSLLMDSQNRLWIGTLRNGLSVLDLATGQFKRYPEDLDSPTSLNNNTVLTLFERPNGHLWVGTFDGGLNLLNPETETFEALVHDPGDPTSLSENQIRSILEDSAGRLWVGTREQGLNLRLPGEQRFRRFKHDPQDPKSLANDSVVALTQDSRGDLWLGTYVGLQRIVIDGDAVSFETYGEEEGLARQRVYSILEDAAGHLWLSTSQGISRLDREATTFTNLGRDHGLPPGGYGYNSFAQARDGVLHYGSPYGLTSFDPGSISLDSYTPKIILTNAMILDKPVELLAETADDRELRFSHRDSLVSFEFSLLDFAAPNRNRYEHLLQGFDDDWIDLGNYQRATYSNLPAGSYTFRVRAANSEGTWSAQDATLAIRVLPPPWASWWAYALYLLLAVGLAVTYVRYQTRKQQREAVYTQRLEREVYRRTRELAEQNEKLRYANELLEVASVTDSLTGVRNRRFLLTTIDHDIALVDRSFASDADSSRQDSAFVFILFSTLR